MRLTLPPGPRVNRGRGLALAAWLAVAAGVGLPPTASAASSSAAQAYTFAFQNADIAQVVQEVLGQVGAPYTLDPAVTGQISFRIEQRLTREQLLAALEAVLASNNVAMVRNGEQLLITPASKARGAAEIRRGAGAVHGSGYELVAVPLGYAQPSEVSRALDAISAGDTVVYANDKLGLLLLGGSGPQLRAALDTLKVFDQSAFQDSKIRWYELAQAQATTVAGELERIVQASGLVGVTVVPLRRLNGVIVFGRSGDSLDEIGKWVARLDTPGKDVASTLWVYRPRFTSADSLARTLGGLLGVSGGDGAIAGPSTIAAVSPMAGGSSLPPPGPSPPQAAAPALGTGLAAGAAAEDQVRIGVDRETNTLLFFAAPTKWVQIQRILNETDRPQREVLIEASIVEVTLGKQFQFGVDWSVFAKNLQISSVNNTTGSIAPSFPGLSVTYIDDDIAAAVKALGSRTAIEVVSAPKIIALDNHTARLQVGDQVPVVIQAAQQTTTSSAPLVSTVDYRNTGVILTVTPRIAGDDRLVLDVTQEVSSVAKTSSSGIDSPTIQQRRFESTLVVQNGHAVALGGLISSTRSDNDSGVPGLKNLPGVGALFRTSGRDDSRSELIVLLSARIIGDGAAADRAMSDLASDMKELESRGLFPAAQP